MVKYEFIQQNIEILREGVKLGVLPYTLTRDFDVFNKFNEHPNLSKTERYENIANEFGFKNPSSVKKIVESFRR